MLRIACYFFLCGATFTLAGAGAAQSAPSEAPPPARAAPEGARAPAMQHAPRAYALILGSSYAFRSQLPLGEDASAEKPWGLFVGGRLGWQVGGLAGGAPATIGFETDFLYQTAQAARSSYGLRYGLFVKHALTARPQVRPFFCYGLGAAQLWIRGIDGRGIGHVTKLGFGLDLLVRGALRSFVALSYEAVIMPRFAIHGADASDTSVHALAVSTGIWYGQ